MAAKKRTSVLVDVKALEDALLNKEIAASLRELFRKGRGRFVDVDRSQ